LFMLANAEVLWERGKLVSNHVRSATVQFEAPAPALSQWDCFVLKTECSTRLSRLMDGSRDAVSANLPFLLGGLLEKTVEACLRLNRRWYLDTGHGLRDLKRFLPERAEELSAAVTEHEGLPEWERLRTFLSTIFGEEFPLKDWDSGLIHHG
jgi:hypothetical protein